MPLSPAVERKHLHTRTIEMNAFVRDDGLWDIEGRLRDTKPYSFPNEDRGLVEAGDPLHDMNVRLTVDGSFEIRQIEIVMDKTPYTICSHVAPNFQALVGHRIGPGWRRKLREISGGVKGCTHVLELLGAMATVAYQSAYSSERVTGKVHTGSPINSAKFVVNSCYAHRADGPVTKKEFPDHYTGEDQE